jgi:hypothetical protein
MVKVWMTTRDTFSVSNSAIAAWTSVAAIPPVALNVMALAAWT